MPRNGCAGYREIASRLRQQWLSAWSPGRRLPAYEQLEEQLGTTRATLQRAMDLLVWQGFVVTRPTVGAYLADHRPDEYTIGLVLPGHPEETFRDWHWTRFFQALYQAAERINMAEGGQRVRVYTDCAFPEAKGFNRLVQDVADGCLAGLVFPQPPVELADTALLREQPVPMVFQRREFVHARLAVNFDRELAPLEAMRIVAARGRSRPAILAHHNRDPEKLRLHCAAALGRPIPCERLQAASAFHPQWIRSLVRLLLSAGSDERPDALVVTDDHMVEPVAEALVEMGVRVPDDVLLVSHWNFPLVYRGRVPAVLLGLDAGAWLRRCIELVSAVRSGAVRPPHSIELPLSFCNGVRGATPEPMVAAAHPRPVS